MIRIRMTANLIGEDRRDWLSGEVHEASEWYAKRLIGRGAAVLAEPESTALPSSPLTTASLTNGDPVAVHRDPASPKRGRKPWP